MDLVAGRNGAGAGGVLRLLRSTTAVFIVSLAALLGSVVFLFSRFALDSFPDVYSSAAPGCMPDGEGSWSIGFFYGDSPLSLKPIEQKDEWRNSSAAWPVANPIFTCASASDAGFPSNFVADPFLHVQDDTFFLFFETKNAVTLQGDIGVAVSKDMGATWKHLGIALDEEWHLSYPYVFHYDGQIYMLPESSKKGDLRLYRAVKFPLEWKLEKVILKRPLIDSFIVEFQGYYWLFGSDFSFFGAKKNGELEIWYSNSPLGPWKPHKKNPIHNGGKSLGARNAGRPFIYNDFLYRTGQDCGETYGKRIRLFQVTDLTPENYAEVEIPFGIKESKKGRNSWDGVRRHHLDVQQLPSGKWVAVMDGDNVSSGDPVRRYILGYTAFGVVILLVVFVGISTNMISFTLPLSWRLPLWQKRSNSFEDRERLYLRSKHRWLIARIKRLSNSVQGSIKIGTCRGKSILGLVFLVLVIVTCIGTKYLYGGNGADKPFAVKGHYSQFTLLTMTYDARLWNLNMFVKHYSRCPSVREIVVVWNKGLPPDLSSFDSAVPIRIRVEEKNSLNNRFIVDPAIRTRAVLELDDDILMTCRDVERGFRVWREYPDRIVGFYPRLAQGSPSKYRDERYARQQNGYNMILTGAAFVDGSLAFHRYWSNQAEEGRNIVDRFFNCEDVLLNFLYVNASSSPRTVEYVKPSWAIDTSKFSGGAISKNTQMHYQVRSQCLEEFARLYGSLGDKKWEFGSRRDGWDV